VKEWPMVSAETLVNVIGTSVQWIATPIFFRRSARAKYRTASTVGDTTSGLPLTCLRPPCFRNSCLTTQTLGGDVLNRFGLCLSRVSRELTRLDMLQEGNKYLAFNRQLVGGNGVIRTMSGRDRLQPREG
jgi:hypothetical protein